VIRVLRREQREIFPVESDAVEVGEIWIPPFFAPDPEEIEHAVFLVDTKELCDVALAGGDAVLELSVSRSYR